MKFASRLICLFLLPSLLFGADAAFDLIWAQRNSGNTGTTQRNVAPLAGGLLGTSSGKLPVPVIVGTGLSYDTATNTLNATGSGSGTVTTVSVVTANGVSGSVANATTTPAITLTLGNITPTSITTGAGSFTTLTTSGNVGIGMASSTMLLGITNNAGGLPTNPSASQYLVHIGNTDSTAPGLLMDGSGAAPLVVLRRAGGTKASPSATTNGTLIGLYGFSGYGTTTFASSRSAVLQATATETWTDSATGTKLELRTAANGSTSLTTVATILSTGVDITGALSTTGLYTSTKTGQFLTAASSTTGAGYLNISNTSGLLQVGVEDSTGSTFGASGYDGVLYAGSGRGLSTVIAGTGLISRISATGLSVNGQYSVNSNANKRGTKSNFNITTVNVKDYGATGDGSTDDRAAIAAACAAMTNYSALYFPPGNYRVASGIYSFASLNHFTIYGEGATITNDSGASGANTFVFEHTCSDVEIRDMRFVGTATTRGSGIHLRVYCGNVRITNNYISRCSDFGIHISNDTGDTTLSYNIVVEGNTFVDTLGDGLHISSATNVTVANNVFYQTGDDSIGIVRDSLTASGTPSRIVVIGNVIQQSGYGTAAVSGMGIRVAEADDVLIEGNNIDYTYQAPIVVERYLSTSAFNNRIQIKGNKVINGNQLAGQLGSIGVSFCQGATISDNKIDDAANGNGIAWLDCNDLVIQGNQIRNIPSRGIGSDDGTTTNVATNSYRVWILNNQILYTLVNQAIYCVAPTGKTINDMVIAGNVAGAVPAGDYIYYNRVTNGKVYNNLQLASNTIGAGGTVSGVTTGNNN